VGSAYGAAGSLVIILVWVYYSAQILLFGEEFTQVYANKVGARIAPAQNAEVADPDKASKPKPQAPYSLPGGRDIARPMDNSGWTTREASLASGRPSTSDEQFPWWVGLVVIGVSLIRSSRRSTKSG
jgi:membrane protein